MADDLKVRLDPFSGLKAPTISRDEKQVLKALDRDIQLAARHYERAVGNAASEDIAQEVRTKVALVVRERESVEEPFLRTVIKNAALSAFRRERRHQTGGESNLEADVTPAPLQAQPHDATAAIDVRRLLLIAREPERQVFDALYVDDMPQRQAAQRMGVSQSRVAQLHRSLLLRGASMFAASDRQ